MSSIKDFENILNGQETITKPNFSLAKGKFRLLEIKPFRDWITTGEVKADGSPKWAQSDEYVMDDTQEKMRFEVSLLITDGNGLSTSATSPFIYNNIFLSLDELKKVNAHVGKDVKLKRPRIEFKEVAVEKKGFKSVQTVMNFVFDGFDI